MDNIVDLDYLHQLIRRHDLTYEYSDSHSVYKKGLESLERINRYAQGFDKEVVNEIWNTYVDQKLNKNVRDGFYRR